MLNRHATFFFGLILLLFFFFASPGEALLPGEIDERYRIRQVNWQTEVLRSRKCPLGSELHWEDSVIHCCDWEQEPVLCLVGEEVQMRPITGVVFEVLDKEEKTVLRTLYYNQSPHSVVQCLNYDEIISEPLDVSQIPLPPGLERAESGGLGPCIVDPNQLRWDYTHHFLLALPLLDMVQEGHECFRKSTVLMIGLGGGTFPYFLSHNFPQMKVDIIEIEPTTIVAARSMLGFRAEEENPDNVRVFLDDAVDFVREQMEKKKEKKKYDIIFLDAMDDDYIPDAFLEDEFLEGLRKLVEGDEEDEEEEEGEGRKEEKENGIVAFNLFLLDSRLTRDISAIGKHFSSLKLVQMEDSEHTNCILFAHNPKETIRKKNKEKEKGDETTQEGREKKEGEDVQRGSSRICNSKELKSRAEALEKHHSWAKMAQLTSRASSSSSPPLLNVTHLLCDSK